ncbi:AraC family transcriptional regulator ligand-binding domain-containing protein [Agrobacterium deltaense]
MLLAKALIEAAILYNPDAYIPASQYGTLLEIAAHALHRPSFGLEWAQRMALPTLRENSTQFVIKLEERQVHA